MSIRASKFDLVVNDLASQMKSLGRRRPSVIFPAGGDGLLSLDEQFHATTKWRSTLVPPGPSGTKDPRSTGCSLLASSGARIARAISIWSIDVTLRSSLLAHCCADSCDAFPR